VNDFEPAVTESAQSISVTAILLAVMLIVSLGPRTTGQTLLGKKMDGVAEVFVTGPSLMTVTIFSGAFGHRGCSVETGAVCIYSQLRSFSSSEVAAMIEGLVRHDTEMRVEKNFVDSHGQSEVAFAFCHLLGTVRLMLRLKRIKYERLYLPAKGIAGKFLNLIGVLTRPIRWDLITQQYDEMLKAAVALKDGTATAEAILRRFNSCLRKF
jgi:hypothetical protein